MGTVLTNMLSEQSKVFRNLVLRKNFWIVLLIDIVLIVFSILLSYCVRFDGVIVKEIPHIVRLVPILIGTKILVFYLFGLYRGMWRYTSISDLVNIVKAVTVSSGLIVLIVLYSSGFQGFSRSVFFLDGTFTFLFI